MSYLISDRGSESKIEIIKWTRRTKKRKTQKLNTSSFLPSVSNVCYSISDGRTQRKQESLMLPNNCYFKGLKRFTYLGQQRDQITKELIPERVYCMREGSRNRLHWASFEFGNEIGIDSCLHSCTQDKSEDNIRCLYKENNI